jgi:glycosyltransferase involved in cell wall biosynthesis
MIAKRLKLLNSLFSSAGEQGRLPYIPFDSHTSVGGPTTFLNNLRTYCDKAGIEVAPSLKEAGVILFPIAYDWKKLKRFKARGGKICQRLDGVYNPSANGKRFAKHNIKMKDIYLKLADHVIFQSKYSRAQCFDMFGEKKPDEYSFIMNGVNNNTFYPDKNRVFDRSHINFCTTGSIRKAAMLEPLIKALDLLTDINFSFHIAGPIKNGPYTALMNRPYVVYHGECNMAQIAEILRCADIFLFSNLNPPCPNSVLEAIATGLPIVGYNSGSMAELASCSPELLADAGKNLYHLLDDYSPELLAEKILLAVNDYEQYRATSIGVCKNYSMDDCGQQYVDVMKKLLD